MGCVFIKPVMVTTNSSVNGYTELLQNMRIAFNFISTFKADKQYFNKDQQTVVIATFNTFLNLKLSNRGQWSHIPIIFVSKALKNI